MTHDLGSAAMRMAGLVRGVADEQLGAPPPCVEYSVAALLDHIATVAVGLTGAARKEGGAPPPLGDATNLDRSWRTTVPSQVEALAAAWREPGALEGTLDVGGIEMAAEAAFTVALEELVIHGWDLAKATGQPFDATAGVELDRLVAISGRDPGWSP